MRYWLMKSEPSEVSIDDLAKLPKQTVAWYGVRNYQARNFMRDDMKVGDPVLFMLGQDVTPQKVAELRAELGLDQPFFVQFFHFMGFINYLGLPSLSAPIATDLNGRPISVQLVGRPFADLALLDLAAHLTLNHFSDCETLDQDRPLVH